MTFTISGSLTPSGDVVCINDATGQIVAANKQVSSYSFTVTENEEFHLIAQRRDPSSRALLNTASEPFVLADQDKTIDFAFSDYTQVSTDNADFDLGIAKTYSDAFSLSSNVSVNKATLTGTVYFRDETEPLESAEVYAVRESDGEVLDKTSTDANGDYILSVGPATSGDTIVVAADYFDSTENEYFGKTKSILYE